MTAHQGRRFFVACALMFSGIGVAAETLSVPAAVAQAVEAGEPGTCVRIRWKALQEHPVMVAVSESKSQHHSYGFGPAASMIRALFFGVERIGLDAAVIDEAWLIDGRGGQGIWLKAASTGDMLDDALRTAGWERDPEVEDAEVWVRDSDPETLGWQKEALEMVEDDDERAEMVAAFNAGRPRIVRCGAHWLLGAPYGRHEMESPEGCGEGAIEIEEKPPFPRDVLFDSSPSTLISFALDIHKETAPEETAQSDEPEEDAEPQDEREALLAQLQAARGSDVDMMTQLGDMAVVLSEVDGGLAFDLVARRPDGGGVSETARFLRMLVLGMRFAIAPTAPELERELGYVLIEEAGDSVRLSCTVSQATLIETIEQEKRRRSEIEELQRRLDELDQVQE